MKHSGRFRPLISVAILLTVLVGIIAGSFYWHVGSSTTHAANPAIVPHTIKLQPQYNLAGQLSADGTGKLFDCQSGKTPLRCYGPHEMRQAYSIQPLIDAGYNGTSRTIVIIDAYQSPTLAHDLNMFNRVFNLRVPTLNLIAPDGLTPFNPSDSLQVSWAAEISLDVEWAHAIAPNATIDLVLAKSGNDTDILSATAYAINNNLGDVISQSFGEAEACADPSLLAQEHQLFQQATTKGITLIASSGDTGAAQYTCDGTSLMIAASTPASDPYVTAVGGTYLNANALSGSYHGEATWNDSFGASGGGYSSVYKRPTYQSGIFTSTQRGLPDVAYDGDVNGGVLVVWSSSGHGSNLLFLFGGTSAGSPQWAAITAIADQHAGTRLGLLNTAIYSIGHSSNYLACFHDIQVGTNSFGGLSGYNSRQNWDAATGWGTPIVNNLVPAL